MIVLRNSRRGCMKFETLKQGREFLWVKEFQHFKIKIREESATTRSVKRSLADLLFEICKDCERMAAIPQGAFAACKVRRNLERNAMITSPIEEREKVGKENTFNMRPPSEGRELTPLKYNSKLMNSIWGLYNRYSVHNFKKNNSNDGVFGKFAAIWETISHSHAYAANSVITTAVTNNNSQIMQKR
ncbi:uncharacterized protein LOC126864946 [Bombus huntii]|uniref:uncharacterized protein LOC126864946 n=1 Tax=Bombus huntii TaxID=85661 RepID=UPI0021AA106B|nr:uncharacterized protein LOC126864946 [Bombus huntii]XP_050472843.1 uncharacterized protein LOC126864946 [Bombus huntii]